MNSEVMVRKVPVRKIQVEGKDVYVATVFDLFGSYLGVDRGLGGECAKSYADNIPFTPAWQEKVTGVEAQYAITLGREFATAASSRVQDSGPRLCADGCGRQPVVPDR